MNPMTDRPDDGALVTQASEIEGWIALAETYASVKDWNGAYHAMKGAYCSLAAASPAQVASAPDRAGVDVLVASTKHHIAYLRSFNKQPLARSVELMEGLIAALSATPSREGESVRPSDSPIRIW